jgi:two-component system nitrate/nitrite response regulator NarL
MKRQELRITIVIADDHPVVLHGAAELLRSTSGMKVLATCGNGRAALEAIRKWQPSIALLDMSMPGLSAIEMLSGIAADAYQTKVVFLTAAASDEELLAAIAGGAKGIVLKNSALKDLVRCIRAVASGGDWLPSDLIGAASEPGNGRCLMSLMHVQSLTTREREVILLIAEGLVNKDVARRLGVSEGTVKVHLHNIFQKTGVNNRTALAALALAELAPNCGFIEGRTLRSNTAGRRANMTASPAWQPSSSAATSL